MAYRTFTYYTRRFALRIDLSICGDCHERCTEGDDESDGDRDPEECEEEDFSRGRLSRQAAIEVSCAEDQEVNDTRYEGWGENAYTDAHPAVDENMIPPKLKISAARR